MQTRDCLQSSRDAFFVADTEGRILDATPAFFDLIEWRRDSSLQSPVIPLLMENAGLWSTLRDRLNQGDSVRGLELVLNTDGGRREVCMCTGKARSDGDGPAIFLGRLLDLRDAEAASELSAVRFQLRQARKLASLGKLAGSVAHNFNNSLVAIVGLADLTRHEVEAGSAARSNLEQILKAAREASELVGRILVFSREALPHFDRLEMGAIVSEGVKLLRAMLPKSIVLRERIDDRAIAVNGHRAQIHEVLLNLGSNAAHAIGEGSGTIDISLALVRLEAPPATQVGELSAGVYARLSVQDDGEGMGRTSLSRVFDPFYTTKSEGEGTGLGLAAVADVVLEHGGAIRADSKRKRGTVFHIYFPTLDVQVEGSDCS